MALQLSVAVRNARLDAIETTIGATAVLKIFDGAKPANCAAADVGTELVVITCPADYFNPASAGAMTKLGTWEDTSADGTGTAQYFRLYESTAVTCHMQGDVGLSGSDLNLDNTSINATQQVTITTFTLTDGNA